MRNFENFFVNNAEIALMAFNNKLVKISWGGGIKA